MAGCAAVGSEGLVGWGGDKHAHSRALWWGPQHASKIWSGERAPISSAKTFSQPAAVLVLWLVDAPYLWTPEPHSWPSFLPTGHMG